MISLVASLHHFPMRKLHPNKRTRVRHQHGSSFAQIWPRVCAICEQAIRFCCSRGSIAAIARHSKFIRATTSPHHYAAYSAHVRQTAQIQLACIVFALRKEMEPCEFALMRSKQSMVLRFSISSQHSKQTTNDNELLQPQNRNRASLFATPDSLYLSALMLRNDTTIRFRIKQRVNAM